MEATAARSQAEYGRIGARRTWGEPRVCRLDALDPSLAAYVRAVLTAQENAQKQAAMPADEIPQD